MGYAVLKGDYMRGGYAVQRGDPFLGGLFSVGAKLVKAIAPKALKLAGGLIGVTAGATKKVVATRVGRSAAGAAGAIAAGAAGTYLGGKLLKGGGRESGARGKRMNPANVKALRRAIRRMEGFQKLAKSTGCLPKPARRSRSSVCRTCK